MTDETLNVHVVTNKKRRISVKQRPAIVLSALLCITYSTSLVPSHNTASKQAAFTLPALPYAYDALEPYIDAQTMEIHHTKHHQAYINKLNDALKDYPDLQRKSLEWLITNLESVPSAIRTSVRNNGGGHFAHSLYWKIMTPHGGSKPSGNLAKAIDKNFGSFNDFKKAFDKEASSLFGSGWTWLCTTPEGRLQIVSTPGHDVPMNQGLWPILVVDVWEHAYYLKHQNRRGNYIDSWWNIINWPQVEKYYEGYIKQKEKP